MPDLGQGAASRERDGWDAVRELAYALFRSNIDWSTAAQTCGDPECAGDCVYVADVRRIVAEVDGGIIPPPPGEKKVLVPRAALKMLYECAKDFDRRIPQGNGSEWAEPFQRLFEED